MKKYVILAETGADIPKNIITKYGIYIVPMHVNFGSETKDDGSFPTTDLFDYYKKHKELPKTAGCNAHDFTVVLDQIRKEHPESHILYLAYSAVTTISYASALLAMEDMNNVTAWDTKFCSAGQAFVVTMAARYIDEHPDTEVDEIISYLEDIRSRTHMGFFPGDLVYLKAGGRVSNAAYIGAKILSLSPLIEINDGYLVATKKYRGKTEKIAPKLLNDFTETYHFDKSTLFLVHSPGLSEELKADMEMKAKELGYIELIWVETGAVVSTHSGPAAFGIVGMESK